LKGSSVEKNGWIKEGNNLDGHDIPKPKGGKVTKKVVGSEKE